MKHRRTQSADALLLRGRALARALIYGATVILAGVQIGYQAAEITDPTWLTVATAVIAFYAGLLGLGNVTRAKASI